VTGLADIQLNLITSIDDMLEFKRWLGRRRPIDAIAFDTETDGFNVINGKVRLIQFGDGEAGWAMDRDEWLGVAREVFATWEGDLIAHNAIFDVMFLESSCGISVPRHRVHDTMVQSAINESHMSKALKTQASRHVDPAAAGLQAELAGTKWTWANVPTTYGPYWMYGALDPVLTYKLHEHHHPIVMAEAPDAYDLEMAVLWVVEKMRRYGTFVDRPRAAELFAQFHDYAQQVECWVQAEYGVKPGSNAAVVRVLEEAGYRFTKATKAGAVSLDSEVLSGIKHPLAEAVLGRRKAQKMASTYLQFYTERADESDLIHPSFNTLGARTSRMSCSDPNLQNLPRLGTSRFGDVVRNCIKTRYGQPWSALDDHLTLLEKATHPDAGSLVMCDFDQIEMRIMAHFAQEPAMIEAFKSEGDFFVNLARQLFQDDTITKKDKRRQITKNAGYAKIYFAGIAKFAQTAVITTSEARAFMRRWDELYPGVGLFSQAVLDAAGQRKRDTGLAFARSPLTNRRFVADTGKEYTLINYLVQGAAAEINKRKLVEADSAGLGEWMFATVHDEVLLDVPGEHVRDAVHTLQTIMNDDTILDVPITAGVSFGERWGEKVDW
jgi:DNA polymerase I